MSKPSQNSAYFAGSGGKRRGVSARLVGLPFLSVFVLTTFLERAPHGVAGPEGFAPPILLQLDEAAANNTSGRHSASRRPLAGAVLSPRLQPGAAEDTLRQSVARFSGASGLVASATPNNQDVAASPSPSVEQVKTVRSHDGNFIVTAPDASVAGWVGRVAELTRGRVFALLGHDREWGQAATIAIRERTHETEEGELRLCAVSVAKGAFIAVATDVYPNRRDDAVVLHVVKLCLADISGVAAPQKKPSPAAAVPPWLVCGVAENLSAANLPAFREYAADIVSKETFLSLEELFRTDVVPLDEAQRELFFKESASVVDFLLHREGGKSKLRQAIARLGEEGNFKASLLFAFSRDFGELPQLQEHWKGFAVRQAERTIGSSRMSLSETKKALDGVLIAEIPSVNRESLEEKVVTTDLPGLFRHRNKLVVQQIASQKASEVFSLSLRAMPQYSTILQEYLTAITAIARGDRTEFRKHFASAERLRRKLEESPDFKAENDEK